MSKNVIRAAMYRRCLSISVLIIIIITFHPERHAKHYKYISKEKIIAELIINEHDLNTNLTKCDYNSIIKRNEDINLRNIYVENNLDDILPGGEYIPQSCQPLYKPAIIIPYRDRKSQLDIFLNYMHNYLQKQQLHYKIYVVEQNNELPFNRGKLLNIGALTAITDGFKCIIMHDVDLIPLTSGNIYACSKLPRHMSSCIDKFRFQVMYRELFGGVVALDINHFLQINGLSNSYDGWGGEDDDLFRRLKSENISTCRFAPELSRYTMLRHQQATPSPNRINLLTHALERQHIDGLNNLLNEYKTIEEPLFTRILMV